MINTKTQYFLNVKFLKLCLNINPQIWSKTHIGGWPVEAEYVLPPAGATSQEEQPEVDPAWCALHVQQSQYCLMIVK